VCGCERGIWIRDLGGEGGVLRSIIFIVWVGGVFIVLGFKEDMKFRGG
jgi:hypothetical protein